MYVYIHQLHILSMCNYTYTYNYICFYKTICIVISKLYITYHCSLTSFNLGPYFIKQVSHTEECYTCLF